MVARVLEPVARTWYTPQLRPESITLSDHAQHSQPAERRIEQFLQAIEVSVGAGTGRWDLTCFILLQVVVRH